MYLPDGHFVPHFMGQYRDDDHGEDTPNFISRKHYVVFRPQLHYFFVYDFFEAPWLHPKMIYWFWCFYLLLVEIELNELMNPDVST